MPASAFKSKALPLHVNITHTPPSIADDESVPAANADPGFLSAVTLTATSFNTGSYGWKGSKRFTVELQGSGDEKEKVQVMLRYVHFCAYYREGMLMVGFSINATVVGSKQAPGDGEEAEEKEETAKEDEKTADEEEKEADEEKKAADEE